MIQYVWGGVIALALLGGGILVGKSLQNPEAHTVSNAQVLKTLESAQQRSQQSNTELLRQLKSLGQSIQSLDTELWQLTNQIQSQSQVTQTPALEVGPSEAPDETHAELVEEPPSEMEAVPRGLFSFLPPEERQFQESMLTLPPDERARQSHQRWLNKNRAELERVMKEMDALDPDSPPSDG